MSYITSEQSALASHFIDAIVQAGSNQACAALTQYGIGNFPYGCNPTEARILLERANRGNNQLFKKVVKAMNVDASKLPPNVVSEYRNITGIGTAKFSDLIDGIMESIAPKTITGDSSETIKETKTGAYVAYVVIAVAIAAITVYMLKVVK